MREKWFKKSGSREINNGSPLPSPKSATNIETIYKPKLLKHTPSLRAMRNYNDLSIGDTNNAGHENAGFEYYEPDKAYDPIAHSTLDQQQSINGSKTTEYDYPNMGTYPNVGTLTLSMKTTISGGSEFNSASEFNEMGSSVKLVTSRMELTCKTCCTYFSTIVCTITMAAGFGNLYRLPQTTYIRGGLPFFVVYAVLTLLIGLPLLFLEIGIGQMAQEGFIKSWRVVPFFKGIGYVKLFTTCLLSIYYPLYMGLSLFYVLWMLKGDVPFTECASGVIITYDGYSTDSKNGQECLRQTFLKSPFQNPYWFGIYAAIIFFLWILITFLSFRKTKSYFRSLLMIFLPTMACYIALTSKSIILEKELSVLYKFFENVDWSVLGNAEVWYYATIQVFFSTNIGFGSFVTNGGIIHNKVSPLWTSMGYIVVNLIFGGGSVIICHIFTGSLNVTISNGDVAEIQLFSLMYDAAVDEINGSMKPWIVIYFVLVLLSGLISMATISYTALKAVTCHTEVKLKWWQASLIFTFIGFVTGCAILLKSDFDLVHLLDHYIVGNLILICVIIEVLALAAFYGTGRIQSDFEFMLGHKLLKTWLILWWFIPLLLTAIFAWGLATLPLEGIYKQDPPWLYGIGWAVILTAFIFIFIVGGYVVTKQDGYTTMVKLKSALEPSHNWGPKDPMLRHNWVQWNTKTQHGERDFTLKRRGTKEYAKTVKRNAKKAASELSAIGSIPGAYHKHDVVVISSNNNNGRLSNGSNGYADFYYINTRNPNERRRSEDETSSTLRVTSIVDSLDTPVEHRRPFSLPNNFPQNPLAQTKTPDGSISEGYGTFRKGPYTVEVDDISHVCHRKFDNSNILTTEL